LIRVKISKNEEAIKHPNKRYRILYHLDGTDINISVAELIVESISEMRKNIFKLAFVGTSGQGKRRIKKRLIKNGQKFLKPMYFSSMDQAKDWLVSE